MTAPVCAAVEVYLLNKELWSSQIPRLNALMVSMISIILFPLWYFFFLAALLASVYDTEGTKISRRDKRIIYDSQKDTKFPLQKYLMAIVFAIFSPAWFICFVDTGKVDLFSFIFSFLFFIRFHYFVFFCFIFVLFCFTLFYFVLFCLISSSSFISFLWSTFISFLWSTFISFLWSTFTSFLWSTFTSYSTYILHFLVSSYLFLPSIPHDKSLFLSVFFSVYFSFQFLTYAPLRISYWVISEFSFFLAIGTVIYTVVKNRKKELTKRGESLKFKLK